MYSNQLIQELAMNHGEQVKDVEGKTLTLDELLNEFRYLATKLPPYKLLTMDIAESEIYHSYGKTCNNAGCIMCELLYDSLVEYADKYKLSNFLVVDPGLNNLGEIIDNARVDNISPVNAEYSPTTTTHLVNKLEELSMVEKPTAVVAAIERTNKKQKKLKKASMVSAFYTSKTGQASGSRIEQPVLASAVKKAKKIKKKKVVISKQVTTPVRKSHCSLPRKHSLDSAMVIKPSIRAKFPTLSSDQCTLITIPPKMYPSLTELMKTNSDFELNKGLPKQVAHRPRGKLVMRKTSIVNRVLMALAWWTVLKKTDGLGQPFFKACNYTTPPNYYKLVNERECFKPTTTLNITIESYQLWGVGVHGQEIIGVHCQKKQRRRSCYNNIFGITTVTEDRVVNIGLTTSECIADPQGLRNYAFSTCFPNDVCGWCTLTTSTCEWIERKHVTINLVGSSVVVGGLRTTACAPANGICTLADSSIIAWDPKEIPNCKFEPGPVYKFFSANSYLVSEDQGIVMRMLPEKLVCGAYTLTPTVEGFYLRDAKIGVEKEELLMGVELLAVNYVTYKSQLTSNAEFSRVWWELCKVTNDQIRTTNWMASIDPTVAINYITRTVSNVGVYNGLGIYYWRCDMVNDYRIIHSDNCTQDIPIMWRGNHKSISRSRLEIVDYNPNPCVTNLPYAMTDGNSTLIWNGNEYHFDTVNKTKELYTHMAPQTIWSAKINLQYLSAKVSDQMQTMSQMMDSNKDSVEIVTNMVGSLRAESDLLPIFGKHWLWELLMNPVVWFIRRICLVVACVYLKKSRNKPHTVIYTRPNAVVESVNGGIPLDNISLHSRAETVANDKHEV